MRPLTVTLLLSIPILLSVIALSSHDLSNLPNPRALATQSTAPEHLHLDIKLRLLELTNIHRTQAGLLPLKLGTSPAAQLHADTALEKCYNSHWDTWGLKPNHRHALAGGTGYTLENIIGLNTCVPPNDGYAALAPLHQEIERALLAWMASPGHRAAILNPAATTLHLGLAHDPHNLRLVQHFESKYVSYDTPPSIDSSGTLHMQGTLTRASIAAPTGTPTLQIGYEPPPLPLTQGQLAHTHAACSPTIIATVHQPLSHTTSLRHVPQNVTSPACIDPADTDPQSTAPRTPEASNSLWRRHKNATDAAPPNRYHARFVAATVFQTDEDHFHVSADLSSLLDAHGPGIYSLILLATPDHMDDPAPVTAYPIFWKTTPPDQHPYGSTPPITEEQHHEQPRTQPADQALRPS